jgi:hypothetical protein
MSEHYPCLYGLREHCEAIEFAFRILSGEIEKAMKFLTEVTAEPKTDEDKFMKKFYDAINKFMPKLIASQQKQAVEYELTRIIGSFCDLCPHRANAIKAMEPQRAVLTPSSFSPPNL